MKNCQLKSPNCDTSKLIYSLSLSHVVMKHTSIDSPCPVLQLNFWSHSNQAKRSAANRPQKCGSCARHLSVLGTLRPIAAKRQLRWRLTQKIIDRASKELSNGVYLSRIRLKLTQLMSANPSTPERFGCEVLTRF